MLLFILVLFSDHVLQVTTGWPLVQFLASFIIHENVGYEPFLHAIPNSGKKNLISGHGSGVTPVLLFYFSAFFLTMFYKWPLADHLCSSYLALLYLNMFVMNPSNMPYLSRAKKIEFRVTTGA